MSHRLMVCGVGVVCISLLAVPARAAALPAACNSTFTFCVIPENSLLELAFQALPATRSSEIRELPQSAMSSVSSITS
jgi:hypothetical protein